MSPLETLQPFGLILLAYLSGSLPFAIWVTRLVTGSDVRERGSGHATTTNTIRQAGFAAGALVFVGDVIKGYLPVLLALALGSESWVVVACGAAAVLGHCWTVFAGFRGGMGLATSAGVFLAISPWTLLVGLGILLALLFMLRHAAQASVVAACLTPVGVFLLEGASLAFFASLALAVVVGLRFMGDWRRKYRSLWLDR